MSLGTGIQLVAEGTDSISIKGLPPFIARFWSWTNEIWVASFQSASVVPAWTLTICGGSSFDAFADLVSGRGEASTIAGVSTEGRASHHTRAVSASVTACA